jgi:voltage-gated potassium channel Kch
MVDLVGDAEDREVIESDDFVVVVGYGTVGRVVTDLLQRKFIQYECVEVNPERAALARSKGLPVFYGDVARPEIADAFNIGKASAVIVTIADKAEATRMVIALRRQFPGLKIFARAADADHAQRLQQTLDVVAMVPIIPEDNVLLTLPFGGAVLKSLGARPEEVNAILEAKRKDVLNMRGQGDAEATLVELGVNTDEERAVRIEELREKSPMVAEVLEQNQAPPGLEEIEEEEADTEDIEKSEEVAAELNASDDAPIPASFQQRLLESQLKQS